MQVVLRQARLDPTAVSYVNAHGSGTKQNDRHETAAFKRRLPAAADVGGRGQQGGQPAPWPLRRNSNVQALARSRDAKVPRAGGL